MDDYTQALQGGILVGVASWVLLAGVGRSSGVSAITHGVLTSHQAALSWRWAFLLGLAAGGAFFTWALNVPHVEIRHPLVLVPAGFLVGFGAVVGSGSGSGHLVVGLGRRSRRSLAAVLTFAVTAVVTVMVTSHMPPASWWVESLFEALGLMLRK